MEIFDPRHEGLYVNGYLYFFISILDCIVREEVLEKGLERYGFHFLEDVWNDLNDNFWDWDEPEMCPALVGLLKPLGAPATAFIHSVLREIADLKLTTTDEVRAWVKSEASVPLRKRALTASLLVSELIAVTADGEYVSISGREPAAIEKARKRLAAESPFGEASLQDAYRILENRE